MEVTASGKVTGSYTDYDAGEPQTNVTPGGKLLRDGLTLIVHGKTSRLNGRAVIVGVDNVVPWNNWSTFATAGRPEVGNDLYAAAANQIPHAIFSFYSAPGIPAAALQRPSR